MTNVLLVGKCLSLVKILYTQKTLSKDTLQNKKINKKSKSVPEQPKTEKPKAEKQNQFDPKSVELPANVNRDLWIQFVDMRNSIKKPLTENAVKLLINKLIGFGVGANQSLESSIIGSYQSVYPPKNTPAPVQQPLERRRFGSQANQPAPMRDVQGECA